MTTPAPPPLDPAAAARLRRLNVIVGSVHGLQAVLLLAIATAASLPVTASFLTGPPGQGDYGAASSAACGSTGSSRRSCCSPRSTT